MNVLIAYATKHGCAEKCASILAEKLDGKVDLFQLKGNKVPDLTQYDKVIVGGSVYIGKIQKEVTEFCSRNLDTLKKKKIGFYICCMREGEDAETELRDSFPQELLSVAAAKEYFGGEFKFNKMNFFEKLIVKTVSKVEEDKSNILEDHIERFAQQMNEK